MWQQQSSCGLVQDVFVQPNEGMHNNRSRPRSIRTYFLNCPCALSLPQSFSPYVAIPVRSYLVNNRLAGCDKYRTPKNPNMAVVVWELVVVAVLRTWPVLRSHEVQNLKNKTQTFYKNIFRTSAVSSTNLYSTPQHQQKKSYELPVYYKNKNALQL